MAARDARLLLVLWLAVDVMFILLHAIFEFTSFFNHDFFNILHDRSGGEAVQYIKELWIIFAILCVAYLRRAPVYLPWAIMFVLFLLDDMFQFRELWGRDLAVALGYPAVLGLRQDDLGELTIIAITAAVLLPVLAAAYYWGNNQFRVFSRNVFALLGALAIFGVALDMVQVMVTDPTLDSVVGMIEDGGEMIVMTVIAAFALIALELARRGSSLESPSLWLEDDTNQTARPRRRSERR